VSLRDLYQIKPLEVCCQHEAAMPFVIPLSSPHFPSLQRYGNFHASIICTATGNMYVYEDIKLLHSYRAVIKL
jgi:hypothetical protein